MKAQQTVLITGATDGIGLALAHRYAPRARLVLVGRRQRNAALDVLPRGALYVQADLREPDTAAQAIVQLLDACDIHALDRVIHNAGTASFGVPAEEDAETIRRLLDVNLRAPVVLTHALAPRVLAARGTLALVGSVVAALPCPDYATYGASKAALAGFARSLSVEWRGRARVVCVHPGATRTGIHAKAGISREQMDWSRFPSPARVAKSLHRRIERGRRHGVIGFGNQLAFRVAKRFAKPVDALVRRSRP